MKRYLFLIPLMFLLSLTLLAAESNFGVKDPGLLNLKGLIYYLPEETYEMPADLEQQEPRGVIYTKKLDIPTRDFTEGFPGVTDRFEWFGLIYTGTFEITKPGLYQWRLESDDGSRLWIDNEEIINNDGVHDMTSADAEQQLGKGRHAIKVWYFQGPATEVGLRLFIKAPGEKEKIFSLDDFSVGVSAALNSVSAKATRDGILVQLDAQLLFDSNKFEIKPAAAQSIKNTAEIIAMYPGCLVRIEGHTDNIGSEQDNQKLSENRARAVKEALVKANVPRNTRFEVIGYGETRPVADNGTEAGRAKNRRVEILIVP